MANLIIKMYKRFLNNNDYLSIVTEEALEQLIRDKEIRLSQAEESAEESLLEYLSENYEVEKVLKVGKDLLSYNPQITYPVGAHFYLDGKIYKSIRVINGRKAPATVDYWREIDDYILNESDIPYYTQRGTFMPGDFVHFNGRFYQCLEYNGLEYNNIRIPGSSCWGKVDAPTWIANQPYNPWDVVAYNGQFFALTGTDMENIDWSMNPMDCDDWGLIGGYDPEYNEYAFSNREYVECDGSVYVPWSQPNADKLKIGYNIVEHDPRHPNLKKHLLRLAVYELYKLISPTNISSTRITDYETSIMWLRDASRLRINPQIPRKLDEQNKPVTDIAVATYMRDYDPYKNPWQI